MIWLVDHAEPRRLFDALLQQLSESGIEIWRVDLLQAYYLPRSSENVRTLDGEGVAAVIRAAHKRSDKQILLASYDRMPLPLLRGVNRWQATQQESRLLGAILFYPNLFGPAPIAGEPPAIDPILNATNLPLIIYQPELGSQRWRLDQVVTTLWQAGSPTYVYHDQPCSNCSTYTCHKSNYTDNPAAANPSPTVEFDRQPPTPHGSSIT